MIKHRNTLKHLFTKRFGVEGLELGVEVGVWKGYLSEYLLRAFPNLHLYMVDPWDEGYLNRFRTAKSMLEVLHLAVASTDPYSTRRHIVQMASPGSARCFEDDSLDFVFIDGAHDYVSVTRDLRAWWPKVRKGGIFSGHDYGSWRDADIEHPWDVKKAVDLFSERNNLPLEILPGQVWSINRD